MGCESGSDDAYPPFSELTNAAILQKKSEEGSRKKKKAFKKTEDAEETGKKAKQDRDKPSVKMTKGQVIPRLLKRIERPDR
jgi:hypothetical protein